MDVLSALADPVRAEIIELLAAEDRTAGEIAARFTISGPAVSRHLRVLREHDLVTCRADAQRRIYTLNPAPLQQLEGWAHDLLSQWQQRFEALGRHLDALEHEEEHR